MQVYQNSLKTTVYFGLLLFFGGIYIYPGDSGTQQTFYLLVAFPFLLLFPTCIRQFPWSNKLFYVYLAFPLYMLLSHLWTQDAHLAAQHADLVRGPGFYIKQLVFFVIFILSVYLTMKERPQFLRNLLYFLFVTGFISAIVSIIHHALNHDDIFNAPLFGFSIVDIDKAGSIYTLHYGFSLYLLLNWTHPNGLPWYRLLFITAAIVDLVVIYLTQTSGTWIAVLLLPCLLFFRFWLQARMLLALTGLTLALVAVVFLLGLHEYFLTFSNVEVRVNLIKAVLWQIKDDYLLGIGLTYKYPVTEPETGAILPHPHSIFFDTLRFGGIIGLLLLTVQMLSPCARLWKLIQHRPLLLFVFSWLICGIFLASIYGQQPFVRPGGYMWFLYWMPLALLFAETLIATSRPAYPHQT